MSRLMKTVPLVVLCVLIIAVMSGWANWVQDGVALSTATGDQTFPTITSDGAGGAIVTWGSYRSEDWTHGIYAQRVNASGAVQWTVNGVPLCPPSGAAQKQPTSTSDGAGGAIVTWWDLRNITTSNYDIYAQRVNASGVAQWATSGVAICRAAAYQTTPAIVSDGAGGAIITWWDHRNGNSDYVDIYAQRVNALGAVQWATDGVFLCTATIYQLIVQTASDGAGGAIIAWHDYSGGKYDIYAQKVNASGVVQWTAAGIAICTAIGEQHRPTITSDGTGGAIITWEDGRWPTGVYAQRVNAAGLIQWAADGIAVCTAAVRAYRPTITSDGVGGAIIAFMDVSNYGIYAQRVNAEGDVQWLTDGVTLCAAAGSQQYPQMTSDGAGGAIVAWHDQRSGDWDIYAQRVNAAGVAQWTPDGVALCTAVGNQDAYQIISDGVGGAIVAWHDQTSGNYDIYAQRVDAAGHTVVATLLQNYAATFSGDQIAITWTLSEMDEGIEFSVERATASDGPFIELSSSAVRRDGLSFAFTDSNWEPNMSYWYSVKWQIAGERRALFETGPVRTPAMPLTLFQNSPNPFNPSTEIRYYLPERCSVALDIYNANGALVARFMESHQEKGSHIVTWAGRDRDGRQVNSGVYFYRLKAGKAEISKKMVLLR